MGAAKRADDVGVKADTFATLRAAPLRADKPEAMSTITSIGLAGMSNALARVDAGARQVAASTRRVQEQAAGLPTPSDPVMPVAHDRALDDLASGLIGQRLGQHLFAANLRTVQTADRLLGTLLDAFA